MYHTEFWLTMQHCPVLTSLTHISLMELQRTSILDLSETPCREDVCKEWRLTSRWQEVNHTLCIQWLQFAIHILLSLLMWNLCVTMLKLIFASHSRHWYKLLFPDYTCGKICVVLSVCCAAVSPVVNITREPYSFHLFTSRLWNSDWSTSLHHN